MGLEASRIVYAVAAASAPVAAARLAGAPPVLGAVAAAAAYMVYARIGVVTRADILAVVEPVIGRAGVTRMYRMLKPLLDVLVPG